MLGFLLRQELGPSKPVTARTNLCDWLRESETLDPIHFHVFALYTCACFPLETGWDKGLGLRQLRANRSVSFDFSFVSLLQLLSFWLKAQSRKELVRSQQQWAWFLENFCNSWLTQDHSGKVWTSPSMPWFCCRVQYTVFVHPHSRVIQSWFFGSINEADRLLIGGFVPLTLLHWYVWCIGFDLTCSLYVYNCIYIYTYRDMYIYICI
jgi:hypothetical protein